MNIIRRILPSEYHKYATHLKSLSPTSRYSRFSGTLSDDNIDILCNSLDDTHFLFGIENANLEFIAVGHLAFGTLRDDMMITAEFAVSVSDGYQGKGLGSLMIDRLLQVCRTMGVQRGYMVCLQTNHRIKHILIKNGVKIVSEDGESVGELDIAPPKVDTLFNEGVAITLGTIDFFVKRLLYPWASPFIR